MDVGGKWRLGSNAGDFGVSFCLNCAYIMCHILKGL